MTRSGVRALLAAGILGAGVVGGCNDSTSPGAGQGQTVSLSFAGARPPGLSGVQAVQGALADTLVVGAGSDTLKITRVELVLREIELKRLQTTIDCDTVQDEDACEEFTLGAMLVDLPLAPGTSQTLSVLVDSGTYSEVEFEIHKPGSDSIDQAFRSANPSWPTDISIRVQGTFNGQAFTYTSDLNEEQEFSFSPALVIDASGTSTNLTIRLDVSTWFRSGAGALVDPSTANKGQPNENLVRDNIKQSIKAFEDQDRDGDERDG